MRCRVRVDSMASALPPKCVSPPMTAYVVIFKGWIRLLVGNVAIDILQGLAARMRSG